MKFNSGPKLPDVSIPEPQKNWGVALSWIGMREMEMPIRLRMPDGDVLGLSARVSFGVNLVRTDARGIHMSRLYKLLSDTLPKTSLTFSKLGVLMNEALKSHEGLSDEAKLTLKFELPLERKALISEGRGWRTYPVEIELRAHIETGIEASIGVQIMYSSTCPASAALSRQIQQKAALQHFQKETLTRAELDAYFSDPASLAATPHAQRSLAQVKARLFTEDFGKDSASLWVELIDRLETALGTPVQSLVKREDEQEFAVRNAQNLMFCEDAARRLERALEESRLYQSWQGAVSHLESLHPHDAVAEFAGQIR